MSNAEPTALPLAEAARRIASGELTSVELVSTCLARIAELEPQVQAWEFLDPEHALAQAKTADELRRQGRGVGPLHGVPIAIKDIIDTADMPTENGCAAFKGRQPTEDAVCVSALRMAGAVILGKTVTTELATFTPGKTRNPHNPEHTPGGSSSGSAAAVACGTAPVSLGTQTIGSVIRPAAFCGVYGYKPTFGLIPRVGVMTQAPSLDTVGVIGRSVDDMALVADVLQGYDDRDPASISVSRPQIAAIARQDWPLDPMFAFIKTHAWAEADSVTREAFGELVEQLGGQITEISIDHSTEAGVAAARTVQRIELAAHFGALLDRTPDLISKALAGLIEEGRRISAADYTAALEARAQLNETVEDILLNYGTILTPAALGPAPKGLGSTGNPVFCAFWTYLGVPAVTLPLLEADGLPMGVQLVAAHRDDGRLLRTANWLVKQLEADTD